jgi:hypothetical protein
VDSYARVLHILHSVLAPKNLKVVAGVSGLQAHFLPDTAWRLVQNSTINKSHEYLTTRELSEAIQTVKKLKQELAAS